MSVRVPRLPASQRFRVVALARRVLMQAPMLKNLLLCSSLLAACTDPDEAVHRTIVDPQTGAEFDVEVRFAGGMTAEDADEIADTITVLPAAQAFPGVDLSAIPASSGAPLDESEPTFGVILHPLNDAAAVQRFAWEASPPLTREIDRDVPGTDGLGQTSQALSVDAGTPIYKYLSAGETWKTDRYQCYAPFGFAAMFTGPAAACVDMGYEGKAGTRCSFGFDPRDPVVVVHDGVPDNLTGWSPFKEHYFRGRIKAGFLGVGPAVLHAWGVVCL
jgi:hypothetical protein